MNCYWCSTLRRKELLAYAMENRFNKIALGHHLDDIIETFFMNLLGKGETSPMPPKLVYEKYPVSLIRPLARVEEKYVIAAAKELDIMGEVSTCPFGANSSRLVIRRKIAALTDNSSAIKQRVFSALLELVKTGGGGARAGGD